MIEFRPMENTITYKEKTVLTMLATLIKRMICHKELGLNMYIPISKVNENYDRSIKVNSFVE